MKLPNNQIIYRNGDKFKEEIKRLEGIQLRDIAQTFAHELGHNRGLVHRDMIEQTSIDVNYAKGMTITRMSRY